VLELVALPLNHDAPSLGQLVGQAQAGQRDSFEQLVKQCQGRILRLCLRMLGGSEEARDVAQETFVKAFLHLGQLQPDRSPLPWLTTVATRLCLNRLRSQSRRPQEPLSPECEPVAHDLPLDQAWLRKENQAQVQRALLQLAESSRAVVVLYYLEEWNCRDIGETLGMSESNVKVTLHRSREKLRRWLCPTT